MTIHLREQMAERGQGTESQIRELKVTGHTMALEPGMYCVYNAPGGPAPGQNGLPGVRITAAPGTHMGQVTVASFTPDGWIGSDSAALVRVTSGTAQLLVTVYQAHDSEAEAPQLQVVRLSGETAAAPVQPPAKGQAPASAPATPDEIQVVAHIYGRGDVAGRLGDWMGEAGSQRWIEGFGIAPGNGIAPGDVEYQAVLGRGWLSPWSEGGQFCGSRGMSLPILGVRVRLKGAAAATHRVVLSASFVDGTQIGPVADGEACEAPSLAALEAFQVALVPLAGKPAARFSPAAATPAVPKPTVPKPAAPRPAAPRPKRAAVIEQPAPAPVRGAKPALKPGRKAVAKASAAPVASVTPGRRPSAANTKSTTAPAGKSSATTAADKPAAIKAAASKAAPPKIAPKPVGRAAAKRTPPTTRRR